MYPLFSASPSARLRRFGIVSISVPPQSSQTGIQKKVASHFTTEGNLTELI